MALEVSSLPLRTVDDACNFFATIHKLRTQGKALPPINHVYFAKVDTGLDFEPYLLRAVAKSNRPNNYYVVTKDYIIHVNRMKSTFEVVGTVADWRKESSLYAQIRTLSFFRNYLKAKALIRWLDTVRRKKVDKSRVLLSKQLLICSPFYTRDVISISKHVFDLQWKKAVRHGHVANGKYSSVHCVGIYSGKKGEAGYTTEEFLSCQNHHSKDLKEYIADVLVHILSTAVKRGGAAEKIIMNMPKIEGKRGVIGSVNKEVAAHEQRERQRGQKKHMVIYGNVGTLVRMAHQMQVEAIFKQACCTFFELGKVVNSKEAQRTSVWLFRVGCVVEQGSLALLPHREHLLNVAKTVLANSINALSNVPTCASSTELQGDNVNIQAMAAKNVFCGDALLNEYMQSIIDRINEDYDEASSKLLIYEAFVTATNFSQEWDVTNSQWTVTLESGTSLIGAICETDFRAYITKAMKLQNDVKKLSGRNFGTILVTCDEIVAALSQRLDKIVKRIISCLTILTASQFDTLNAQSDSWISKLEMPELSLEPYIAWVLDMREAEEEYEVFVNNTADLQNLLRLQSELNEKLRSDEPRTGAEPDLNGALRDPFLHALTEAKQFYNANLSKMKEKVCQEHGRIIASLQDIEKRLASTFCALKANEGGTTAVKKLEKVHDSLNRRRQDARKLDGYVEIFDMELLNWTEIGVAEDELKKYMDLWKTFEEASILKDRLRITTVENLNGQDVKDTIISLFQRAFKNSKIMPGDASDYLVQYLGEEKNKVPIYVELCNPALKEKHWESIFERTKVLHVAITSRTLHALDTAGLLEGHEEAITEVVSNAVGVFELEQHIEKIDKYWEERCFDVVSYAGRANAFIIDGVEEILEELEEQQVVVQTCLASKFLITVREAVESWEERLGVIRAVINEWVSVQKAWMYLEFIFSSDDIKRQLPDESLLFSSADRFFSTLMRQCSTDPHIAPLCLEGDALKKLERCTYQLDCIQKKLDEYLETKRVAFPRFYFLSNDELLSILSDSRNPLAVQPHLQKCFDNIKELIFVDAKTISCMKSSEGEVVEFSHEIKIMGNVESWLNDVERAMRDTLYDRLAACVAAYTHEDRNNWYFKHPAQCVATADQIVWTDDVEQIIAKAATSDAAWPQYMEWFQAQLLSTVALVKRNLTALERTVVSNLIVVDVHCRDICIQLSDARCASVVDFDWLKQLRYYWTEPIPESSAKDCVIRHGAAQLSYGYEYLGNQPRLVITPLTERAFLTCTAALHMQKGAAPQGPAGTGKTESVKDLGKALARQVVVFNCSDGLNYKMMSQMFAGLAQGGAWACFDEFNRIELEVLSVVAQQMLDITTAIASRQTSMNFEGHRIKLHPNFGVFVTMNPGYAGRTELPDNLKALSRPICMMIPNYALIAEIMFYSEGYTNAGNLAKKMIRLYSLASQQLSKQDHYDFGMRAVKSILVLAGRLKRSEPDTDEELLLVKAIRDANLPKFLTDDTHLFLALIKDFFPAVEEVTEASVNIVIGDETRRVLEREKLQATAGMISKSQQLFDTLTTRHGLMLVGHTMTGKTTVMDTLAEALTNLGKTKEQYEHLGARYLSFFTKTMSAVCNPKSITMTELYGDVNPMTREWQDGIFSFIVRDLVKETSMGTNTDRHWVVFDGPVDAIWIENLNTVLDDNKMLCLVNGERIRIPEAISILFEVQDLRVASPATVSRCGMVYVDTEALDDGWCPIIRSLSEAAQKQLGGRWRHDRFMELCTLLLPTLLKYVRSECREYVRTVNAQLACNLFYLLKAAVMELEANLASSEEGAQRKNSRRSTGTRRKSSMPLRTATLLLGDSLFDALFVQSCTWGIGGNLADGYRERFATAMMEQVKMHKLYFPAGDAEAEGRGVYDYCVDFEVGDWRPWSELVPAFRYDASLSFFDLVVPTEHTVVLNYLLSAATRVQHHLLFNGLTGTAKSSTVNNFLLATLRTEDSASDYVAFSFTLSAQTSSNNLQETIESKLSKRKGEKELGPPPGKRAMIAVIDDCNVPQLEEYGAAPPVELLRQMLTQGGFYDRKRLFFKEVVQTMLIACCGEPGGGKNELTPRFSSKLLAFCVPQLSATSMRTIFTTILRSFFDARSFSEEVTSLASAAIDSTLEAYTRIAVECLPTPEKTHCTFNLRDVSKVVQGMLQVKPVHCDCKEKLISLWSHEASRVFHDRLVDESDRGWWWRCSREIVNKFFAVEENAVTEESLKTIVYGNWGSQTNRDYQQIFSGPTTQEVVYQYLAEYNLQSATSMDLVLFTEAVQHLSRICRIVNQPRGHALLVGVGGSGRTSLCKLAASMMNMELQTVNIVRGYGIENFRDEMRKALLDGGTRGKEVVFQLSDPQIVCTEMLEDINNVLNIGEVPGSMALEHMEVITRFCREPCINAGRPDTRSSVYQYFVSQCRERVHVVLCMSPMSGSFRERLRMFPALVNCTTIDWFSEWPQDALLAVASAVLKKGDEVSASSGTVAAVNAKQSPPNLNHALAELMMYVHKTVKLASIELFEKLQRRNHTTPTSYLAALSLYQVMVRDLRLQIDSNAKRYQVGLEKLQGANRTIAVLKKQISDMQPALNAALRKAEEQKKSVQQQQREADAMREEMSKEQAIAQDLMNEAEGIRRECEEGLAEAMPALEAAEKALQTLSAKDIQEIKTFTTPPSNVEKTMNAVLILLKEKESWASAKSCLNKIDFLSRLTGYPRDDMSAAVIRKVAAFVNDPDFIPEVIEKTSLPCRSMCMWVHAMYKYYFVAKEVAPKRALLQEAERKVAAASEDLRTKQAALQVVLDKITALEAAAREAQRKADQLNGEIEVAKARLQRADQLTSGLASERIRWETSLASLDKQRSRVVGTAALGAGCVAYLGAFPSAYRERLMDAWRGKCRELGLAFNTDFALEKMLPEAMVQQWALQSLPRDTFSIQNATILQRSARWCYMIDPQGQANAFVRKRENGSQGGLPLLVLKLTDDNFMRSVENAVQVGQPVLLEGVGESLDAALDPVLLRQVRRTGGRNVVTIGDKEVPYDDKFRLYITTKLPNPVLTPELQVKVTVLNFTVTREGLEEQLLADIVGTERAELQRSSDRCVVSIAANREEIWALEEQVLRMLNEASGDVLDNVDLINALQTSKATSEKILRELALVEETSVKITATREKYRPLATRGSLIYSVIADLARVDPMYEYSLQFFKGLVVSVLEAAQRRRRRSSKWRQRGLSNASASGSGLEESLSGHRHDEKDEDALETSVLRDAAEEEEGIELSDEAVAARVVMLTEEVTWASFRVICRGLFERHKLLFSFLLATTVMRSTGEITEEEWDMFLRGGVGRPLLGRFANDAERPAYMNMVTWADFAALCDTPAFASVGEHFFKKRAEWDRWFTETHGADIFASCPRSITELVQWRQLMVLKAVRPETLHHMVRDLVQGYLGERYTRAPAFSINEAFRDSTKLTPIIFVLSPGTDPTALFTAFAEEMGFAERKYMLSLGQDQGPRAQKMMENGRREGCWVYLQNCHVYASWMPSLQRLVEAINPADTHNDFRLWLTSSPSPTFPAAVLQAGMKLTREPPLGLKGKVRDTLSINTVLEAWDSHLHKEENASEGSASHLVVEDAEGSVAAVGAASPDVSGGVKGSAVTSTARWRRLAFTLAIFTGVVMERRQFCPLGWNLPYEWGAADFAAGLCTLTTALSRCTEEETVPWTELCFMLGTIDYGGRVTDMWDTRCLEVIASQFFSAEADARAMKAGGAGAGEKGLGRVPALPPTCTYEELLDFVEREVPDQASPEMFGLHGNAGIAVDRRRSADLVASLVSINSGDGAKSAGGGGGAAHENGDAEDAEAVEEKEDPVMTVARGLLERIPPVLPHVPAVGPSQKPEDAPLHTLLSHEADLYNRLIVEMGRTLKDLIKALKGEVVMTNRTERMAMRLSYNQVPDRWHQVGYLSLKPLALYFDDFLRRIDFVRTWCERGAPPSFWLPGLFFPQGFVTAVLQARSRALRVPIDSLRYRFRALPRVESEAVMAATRAATTSHVNAPDIVGAYVHGVYLEGCGWDEGACGLVESRPGALTVELPVLHFEPVGAEVPEHYTTTYECPLYKVSSRAGTLSTTGVSTNFIVSLILPSLNDVPGDHWTLRGVAGLCSLDV